MAPVIEIKDLVKDYRLGEVPVHVLKGISFQIERGDFVSIMGPSGSGWAHDGNEIPPFDLERDALQHVHRHLAEPIVFHQILDFDYGRHTVLLEPRSSAALAAGLGAGAAAGSRSRLAQRRDNHAE